MPGCDAEQLIPRRRRLGTRDGLYLGLGRIARIPCRALLENRTRLTRPPPPRNARDEEREDFRPRLESTLRDPFAAWPKHDLAELAARRRDNEDDPAASTTSPAATQARTPSPTPPSGDGRTVLPPNDMRRAQEGAPHAVSIGREGRQPFQCRSRGPAYSASGRMMRLFACCSITCAHQPVMRLATKIGVYCGTGIPMMK
ncbi:MAG: hypothetical protein RI967_2645 [Planctomycetota bacterium]